MEDKKSFFEKITGTKSVQQEIEQETPTEQTAPKFVSFDNEEQEAKTKAMPALHKIQIKEEEKKESIPATDDKKDWFADDAEGQLVLDVYQTENDIIVKSTLAGVKSEDIDISITNDMLTIKGVREKDQEIREEDYYYQECYWGVFSRSVILPSEVEEDHIQASLKNGILTIRLPKAEKIKTKKISVMEG